MANKLKPKYNRGDKFTIEIAEVHTHYDDNKQPYNVYRVKGFKSLFVDDYALDKLDKLISVENMRVALKEFCHKVTRCNQCKLMETSIRCGYGKSFCTKDEHGNYDMTDKEIIEAYKIAFPINKFLEEKEPLNTKVVCISDNDSLCPSFTVGKVYDVVDGKITVDYGSTFPLRDTVFENIEDINIYFSGKDNERYGAKFDSKEVAKFIEVVD